MSEPAVNASPLLTMSVIVLAAATAFFELMLTLPEGVTNLTPAARTIEFHSISNDLSYPTAAMLCCFKTFAILATSSHVFGTDKPY